MRGTYPASAGKIDRDFLSLPQGDRLGLEFFDFVDGLESSIASLSVDDSGSEKVCFRRFYGHSCYQVLQSLQDIVLCVG